MGARKIALFLANAENDYMQALKVEAEAAAARAGFDLEVAFAGLDPGKISIEQPQQIYRALSRVPAERPVAVIIFPLLDVAHTMKEVLAARIGVIILNRLPPQIEELRAAHPGLPIFAVSTDQVEAGRVQARQLRALAPDGGLVLAVLGHPLATSTTDRANGLRQALEGSSVRLTTVSGDWGLASGEQAVAKWLRQPFNKEPLRAIACQNDAMAAGARRAVQKLATEDAFAYLRRIPILGIDGSPTFGQKMVDSGELTATVVMPPITRTAIDLLARALKGEAIPAFVPLAPKPHPAQGGRSTTIASWRSLATGDERTQALVVDLREKLRRLGDSSKS
jgi:ABC-type sugar transport system substrate-binding protein